jgi:hypothetical protein
MTYSFKNIFGFLLIFLGVLGLCSLLFFYGVVLFSEQWTVLEKTNEALRLIFSVRAGLLVMYATFAALAIPFFLMVLFGAQVITKKTYLSKFQTGIVVVVWFFAVLFGFLMTIMQVQTLIDKVVPFSSDPATFDVVSQIPLSTQYAFKTTLKNEVVRTQGVPVEGFVPDMFLRAFSGLTITDFEGAEASIGHYTILEGKLVHKLDETKLIHSAAKVLTDRGLDTLLANVSIRLGVDLTKDGTLTQIMDALILPATGSADGASGGESTGSEGTDVGSAPSAPVVPEDSGSDDMVMCTMDAKICPDGSAVGRSGPRCEFAPCPTTQTVVGHVCTDAERNRACTREYMPVCAAVAVQCITTPCNPVPETYGNGCSACANPQVLSYTQGSCQR